MTGGASGSGASSAISSSTSRMDLCVARARTLSQFSAVRCAASRAMPVRCSRPSASIDSRTGCFRVARAAVIRR